MRPSRLSIFLLSFISSLTIADEVHYDRKSAILNGGVKRFRCVEEWVPVDSFGNILDEGVEEIQSTNPSFESSPFTKTPSSLFSKYIRGELKNEARQTVFRKKIPPQQHGVKVHAPKRVTELGPWERELLETLEEELTTTIIPARETNKDPPISDQMFGGKVTTEMTTETEETSTNLFISKTTTTEKPKRRRKEDVDEMKSLESTRTPSTQTTTTFLIPTKRNRMQIGGMKSSRNHESLNEESGDFDEDQSQPEIRRHQSNFRNKKPTNPIRPQTKHRNPHHDEEEEDGESDELQSQDFEDSEDESDFQSDSRLVETERFERARGRGNRRRASEYEDFYDDYEEPLKRHPVRPSSRRRYSPYQEDFLVPAFQQFIARRRAPTRPYRPSYTSSSSDRHLSTLPLSRHNMRHPSLPPPPPLRSSFPSPPPPQLSPLPPVYHRPQQRFPIQQFPLPVQPVRVTPNPNHRSVRRGERVFPSPRPQVTALPIQSIPIAPTPQRVTPSLRQRTHNPPPVEQIQIPMGTGPSLEESTPENCNKMKQMAGDWGITDVVGFSKSNCGVLRSFVPNYTCDEITHFIESCYRKNFFT